MRFFFANSFNPDKVFTMRRDFFHTVRQRRSGRRQSNIIALGSYKRLTKSHERIKGAIAMKASQFLPDMF
ncbi:hypothetical protein AWC35_01655 [Gibbsiella quercinecans]|uniref:Uncharacterized protein n=1 Tax=Gibbsiella quercinecans TaxID=929813 RepID=A0A250AW16_9GAMM|nr:hypothetical protein AWC35_01655 [Gibbsiella quercinecans]RLM06728.1 hypothetical protein BIY30_15680 [Gibbsiella quercinecans]